MSVSPGSRSSPGFCHICRQRNRSAQKQIICPIYRGRTVCPPLQDGAGTKYFGRNRVSRGAPRIEPELTLSGARNLDFLGPIQRVTGPLESGRYFDPAPSTLRSKPFSRCLFCGSSQRPLRACRRHHEIGNPRHDFRFEAGTVEHTVVSDAFLHVMHPAIAGNRTA
jgi:hypothetical protein